MPDPIASQFNRIITPPIVETSNKIKALAPSNQKLISFGQGVPYFGPPAFALEALSGEMQQDHSPLHRYSLDEGLDSLREVLLRKAKASEIIVTLDQILVTAGANLAFYIAVAVLCNPGDEFIVPTPFYFNHVMAIQSIHGIPVFVPRLPNLDLDLEAITNCITNKTKGIIITSPDNPTGSIYSKKTLEAVYQLAQEHDFYVLHDETYLDFVYNPDTHPHMSVLTLEDTLDRTFGIYSFSKAYGMAGYRLGYLLFPSAFRSALMKIQDTIIVCPPVNAQYLAEIILTEENATRQWFKTKFAELHKVRHYVLSQVNDIADLYLPQDSLSGLGGFYIFPMLQTDRYTHADEFVNDLIQQQAVVLIAGNGFGDHWKQYFRIAYGNVSLEHAKEGFERIRTLLN